MKKDPIFAWLLLSGSLAAEIPHLNLKVIERDAGATNGSISLSGEPFQFPNLTIDRISSNRGDYFFELPAADDFSSGVLMASISENGRDNTITGSPPGTFYPTVSVTHSGPQYFIAIHTPAVNSNVEFNVNASVAWFPYEDWLGGFASNASNGGAITQITGSSGIDLGEEFVDEGGGIFSVDLRSLGGSSTQGILLVNGAKNENNFALSKANEDGTFTIFNHDNGAGGANYERDPVAFVYLPIDHNSDLIPALGRIRSNGTPEISAGQFTISKIEAGRWALKIRDQSNITGTLLISPSGGETLNVDNTVSYEWDEAAEHWVIESRDLPLSELEDLGDETAFSFAFINPRSVYVDASASGTNDGSSWENAYVSLSNALQSRTEDYLFKVAEGTYTPTNTSDRLISFSPKPNSVLLGGYPSGGGPRNPDPSCNNTILSGDLLGNDGPGFLNSEENSTTVLVLPDGIIDGFTVCKGNANLPPEIGDLRRSERGGGIIVSSSSLATLRNLIVCENQASVHGGGLFSENSRASFKIEDCLFENNLAGSGGAISQQSPEGIIKRTRFIHNSSIIQNVGSGGGAYNAIAYDVPPEFGGRVIPTPIFTDCQFIGNFSDTRGGAVSFIDGSTPTFFNCLFSGNSANSSSVLTLLNTSGNPNFSGGALITNCAMVGNRRLSQNDGGEIIEAEAETIFMGNTVVWKSTPPLSAVPVIDPTLLSPTNSNNHIQDVDAAINPGFIRLPDPGDGDWATLTDNDYGDLRARSTSPLIDAGLDLLFPQAIAHDLAGQERITGASIDIGPYEGAYSTFALSYPGLDPDLDDNLNGLSNFQDYAAGRDPESFANSQTAETTIVWDGQVASLNYPSADRAADVSLRFEKSSNLHQWSLMKRWVDYLAPAPVEGQANAKRLDLILNPFIDTPMFFRVIYEKSNP